MLLSVDNKIDNGPSRISERIAQRIMKDERIKFLHKSNMMHIELLMLFNVSFRNVKINEHERPKDNISFRLTKPFCRFFSFSIFHLKTFISFIFLPIHLHYYLWKDLVLFFFFFRPIEITGNLFRLFHFVRMQLDYVDVHSHGRIKFNENGLLLCVIIQCLGFTPFIPSRDRIF